MVLLVILGSVFLVSAVSFYIWHKVLKSMGNYAIEEFDFNKPHDAEEKTFVSQQIQYFIPRLIFK